MGDDRRFWTSFATMDKNLKYNNSLLLRHFTSLCHVFFALESRTRISVTDLRRAQLFSVSDRDIHKYNVNGDANTAARIFYSLKPRVVTYVSDLSISLSLYLSFRKICSEREKKQPRISTPFTSLTFVI